MNYYFVSSGVTRTGIEVLTSEYMEVNKGGVANSTTVNSGGVVILYNGGAASNTMIDPGGRLTIYSGGTATNTTMTGGTLYIYGGAAVTGVSAGGGWLSMSSGGIASNITLNRNGSMSLRDGAISSDTTVEQGGVVYCWPSGCLTGKLAIAGSVQDAAAETVASVSSYEFILRQQRNDPFLVFYDGGIAANAAITVDVTNAWGDYYLIDGNAGNYASAVFTAKEGNQTVSLKLNGTTATMADGKKVSVSSSGTTITVSVTGNDQTAPATPGNIKSSLENNILHITWGEVQDMSGVTYELEYATASDFSGAASQVFSSPEGEIALPSGNWHWRLRAIDGAGNKSGWSSVSTVAVNYLFNASGQYTSTLTVKSDTLVKDGTSITAQYPGALRVLGNGFTIDLESNISFSCSSIRNAGILFGEDAYWANEYDYGPHYDGIVNFNGDSISFYSAVSNCITAAGIVGNNLAVNFNGEASGSKNITFESTNPSSGPGNYAAGIMADADLVVNGTFGGDINCHFNFAPISAGNRRYAWLYGFSAGGNMTVNGGISGNIFLSGVSTLGSYAYGLNAEGNLSVNGDISGVIAATAENYAYAIYGIRVNASVTGTLFAGKSSAGNDMETLLGKLKNWDAYKSELLDLAGQNYCAVYAGESSSILFRGKALSIGNIYLASSGSAITVADGARVYGDFQTYYSGNTLILKLNDASLEGTRIISSSSWNTRISLTVDAGGIVSNGSYALVEAGSFSAQMSVKLSAAGQEKTLSVGQSVKIGDALYVLNKTASGTGEKLSLEVSGMSEPAGGPPQFYTGDFNGDLFDTLAVESGSTVTVYMNGEAWGLGVTLDPGWSIAGTGDFSGDGLDDFLRVNDEGYVVGEMSNGNGTFSPQVLNLRNPGWSILGTGDFNGNGTDDVLIANPTGASDTVGLLGYWESGVTWTLINGYSAEWECVATGDFNADGKCDMLWKNSFVGDGGLTYNAYCTWIVDPPTGQSDWRMVSVANPDEWNFLCSGDFDGDGTNDIAMINDVGVVGIWGVNDGCLSSWSILSAVTSEWTLAGVADFNGDGTDDIAWCNTETGLTGCWQIENKELASWQTIVTLG